MKLLPLYNRVLLKRNEATDKVGSIIVPDVAKEAPLEAVIIEVGKEVQSSILKPGLTVLIGKYAGVQITFNNDPFIIVREDEILAAVDGYVKDAIDKVIDEIHDRKRDTDAFVNTIGDKRPS